MYRPRIDLCDGTEPSIADLLTCRENPILLNTRPSVGLLSTGTYNLSEINEIGPTKGLVLAYDFSNNATDASGNGNHGTTYGVTQVINGKLGNAYSFDGTINSYILKNPFLFPSQSFTISLWMKTSDATKAGTPFHYSDLVGYNEVLLYDYRSLIIVMKNTNYTTNTAFNDGLWHHLVVTWRVSDGALNAYKNTTNILSTTANSGFPIVSGGSLCLGQELDAVGGGFDAAQAFLGILDEVKIYNRVLTASEIAMLYNTKPLNMSLDSTGTVWTTQAMEN